MINRTNYFLIGFICRHRSVVKFNSAETQSFNCNLLNCLAVNVSFGIIDKEQFISQQSLDSLLRVSWQVPLAVGKRPPPSVSTHCSLVANALDWSSHWNRDEKFSLSPLIKLTRSILSGGVRSLWNFLSKFAMCNVGSINKLPGNTSKNRPRARTASISTPHFSKLDYYFKLGQRTDSSRFWKVVQTSFVDS